MISARIHLMVNHLPVAGLLIGFLVLMAGSLLRRNTVRETALAILVFSALTTVIAFVSGKQVETTLMPEIPYSETLVHRHEAYAGILIIVMGVLGAVAGLTLLIEWKRSKFVRICYALVWLLTIGAGITATYTGTSGGEIRHAEIRRQIQVFEFQSPSESEREPQPVP